MLFPKLQKDQFMVINHPKVNIRSDTNKHDLFLLDRKVAVRYQPNFLYKEYFLSRSILRKTKFLLELYHAPKQTQTFTPSFVIKEIFKFPSFSKFNMQANRYI